MAFTSSRADFGIMSELLLRLHNSNVHELVLFVTGAHFDTAQGKSVEEIQKIGLQQNYSMEFERREDESLALQENSSKLLSETAVVFRKEKPDLLLVLGDRYETLAPVYAAIMSGVKVAHIHGGEETLGALDDKIRHAISQLSDYHFVATIQASNRLKAALPQCENIFHVGSLSVDAISRLSIKSREQLLQGFRMDPLKPSAIITMHPETNSSITPLAQINELLSALHEFPELNKLFTAPNIDPGSEIMLGQIESFVESDKNASLIKNLGHELYLSCLSTFDFVLGNSSSGMIEAPFFDTPSINVGDRQNGREISGSVIDVACKKSEIVAAILLAQSQGPVRKEQNSLRPYGKLGAVESIINVLDNMSLREVADVV